MQIHLPFCNYAQIIRHKCLDGGERISVILAHCKLWQVASKNSLTFYSVGEKLLNSTDT